MKFAQHVSRYLKLNLKHLFTRRTYMVNLLFRLSNKIHHPLHLWKLLSSVYLCGKFANKFCSVIQKNLLSGSIHCLLFKVCILYGVFDRLKFYYSSILSLPVYIGVLMGLRRNGAYESKVINHGTNYVNHAKKKLPWKVRRQRNKPNPRSSTNARIIWISIKSFWYVRRRSFTWRRKWLKDGFIH